MPIRWAQEGIWRAGGTVTQRLIWANVWAFLLQLVCNLIGTNWMEWLFALHSDVLRTGFVWQLFTYMFLHAGIWHLLVNLLVLWFFGREVETFFGARRFCLLYASGGVAGALLWLGFNLDSRFLLVGASAAVLACVVAFATMFPDREVTLLLFFVLPIRLKAKYLALIAVAADLVPVLEGTGGRVAHLAHLGGAALGWFWVRALGYGRPLTVRWVRFRTRRRRSTEEFIREEIDPILDKIAKHGIESLTRRERRILEAARRRLHTEGRGVR